MNVLPHTDRNVYTLISSISKYRSFNGLRVKGCYKQCYGDI
jgi:hypothetical protein